MNQVIERIVETCGEDCPIPDGLEKAIIGYVERISLDPTPVLDTDKCIELLLEQNNWDLEEAEEWFQFNILGAWMGEKSPFFLTKIEE